MRFFQKVIIRVDEMYTQSYISLSADNNKVPARNGSSKCRLREN